jgi:hypothetical protein
MNASRAMSGLSLNYSCLGRVYSSVRRTYSAIYFLGYSHPSVVHVIHRVVSHQRVCLSNVSSPIRRKPVVFNYSLPA